VQLCLFVFVSICLSVCMCVHVLGCESPSKRHMAAVRKVGLKDVLKVITDVTSSTSRLISGSNAASSTTSSCSVTLPLQQTVAVCTLLMMTDDHQMSSKRPINTEVSLGKVRHCELLFIVNTRN